MSKIIIGIHGLGNKPPKDLLETWWKQAICEGLEKIDRFKYPPKLEMVYWADILNEKPLNPLISEEDNPFFLDEPYAPSSNGKVIPLPNTKRKMFLGFLEEQMDKIFLNEDLTTNFEFVSDLIFKKYFRELDIYYAKHPKINDSSFKSVKDIIRKRLSDVIRKHKGKDIFLIAHSMGSIIAYDVCNFLIPECKIDTLVTMGSPLGIPIIISKIAEEQRIIDPKVKKLRTPECIKGNWYNFADIEDNVAHNFNLMDDYAPNSSDIKVIDMLIENNYVINGERNPHKSYGYLRAPEFSNIIADFLERDTNKFYHWWNKFLYKIKLLINNIKVKFNPFRSE